MFLAGPSNKICIYFSPYSSLFLLLFYPQNLWSLFLAKSRAAYEYGNKLFVTRNDQAHLLFLHTNDIPTLSWTANMGRPQHAHVASPSRIIAALVKLARFGKIVALVICLLPMWSWSMSLFSYLVVVAVVMELYWSLIVVSRQPFYFSLCGWIVAYNLFFAFHYLDWFFFFFQLN